MSTEFNREKFLMRVSDRILPVIKWMEDNNLKGKVKAKRPPTIKTLLYVEMPLPKHYMGYEILWVN
jgi:hypothetical protein